MRRLLAVLVVLSLAVPPSAWSCACGCGVFDVQTSALLPTQPGGIAFLEYDFMDQNKDWHAGRRGSDDDNEDKRIRTHLVTAGVRYMLDRSWGFEADVPYWSRRFATTDEDGDAATFQHGAMGDVRLRGVYAGFSPDMSSGVTFGLKLPTGDFQNQDFDRDTQIGTGSTDLLLGWYKMDHFDEGQYWGWFASAQWDQPVLIAAGYRPGAEIDASAGAYYEGWRLGGARVAPLAQGVATQRWSDSGSAALSQDSGYRRLTLGPGLELLAGRWRLNAGVGFPVWQWVNGNQLIASHYDKVSMSWSF